MAEQLAADLIGTPFVSRRAVANRYGISGQGAGNAIDALVSLGILKPTAMRAAKGAQLFECREVVDVLGS